ncbi:MAG TPA: class I SAM-dependent methyltransferase [Blastocatellia bacterium]|nr:class I SAM-dependent methyltransferase [Blastocatellia bacterium]
MENLKLAPTVNVAGYKPNASLRRILESLASCLPADTAFDVEVCGEQLRIGEGQVKFRVAINNRRGGSALSSLDEKRIGEAYLDGDITVEGDMVTAFGLRTRLVDRHPLFRLWSIYGQSLLFGQVNRDTQWIHEHYDSESDFYLLFLDRQHRCYSHGYFDYDDEPLERAIRRKLDTAIEACGIEPGWRVLDIGAGWGAFSEYAGKRGVRVTSLTISAESERYVNELIARENLPCQVVREHFLEYKSNEPYDAIVNLGVTEHLPDYAATLAQYQKLLKPGGRVFLDACASRTKYPFSSFVLSHVWPGNTTPLQLTDYLNDVAKTPFELVYVRNDRRNYLLTTKHWAENLDRHRDEIVTKWGERLYRRFRLYLWGCVHAFSNEDVTAYRLLLELPANAERRNKFSNGRNSRSQKSLFGWLKDPIKTYSRAPRARRR